MSGSKKKTPAEELIESLLKDMGEASPKNANVANASAQSSSDIIGNVARGEDGNTVRIDDTLYDSDTHNEFESNRVDADSERTVIKFSLEDEDANIKLAEAMGALQYEDAQQGRNDKNKTNEITKALELSDQVIRLEEKTRAEIAKNENYKTKVINQEHRPQTQVIPPQGASQQGGDSEKTVAVAGYQVRSDSDFEDKVKISVGQNRMSTGYQTWNSSGAANSNLGQAENLRIAQEKIVELEQENDKLRLQNEELMSASEIIKERSDLLSTEVNEYRNDREGLADSFKNEIVLLRNHLTRKETELQKSHFKIEELDSRLKFDMKKIRIRERELENRLELIRAEKNVLVKNKDEQILDLRRKMDVLQMEVESYRQKCIELNKSVESSQESFKRTTRALRLAMANLELQEENKAPLKKVD